MEKYLRARSLAVGTPTQVGQLGVPSFFSIWISVDMFRRRLRRRTSVTFVTRSCIAARKTVGAYKL